MDVSSSIKPKTIILLPFNCFTSSLRRKIFRYTKVTYFKYIIGSLYTRFIAVIIGSSFICLVSFLFIFNKKFLLVSRRLLIIRSQVFIEVVAFIFSMPKTTASRARSVICNLRLLVVILISIFRFASGWLSLILIAWGLIVITFVLIIVLIIIVSSECLEAGLLCRRRIPWFFLVLLPSLIL